MINYEERRVTMHELLVELTAIEYDLLRVLSTYAGRVVTYETLLCSVWRSDRFDDRRRVRAFVKKLRDKLGDDADNPTYIFTEPRVGYRMHWPDDAPSDPTMSSNPIITATHLNRRACPCIRQSSLHQVETHKESQFRQYDLRRRAIALGWPNDQIDIVN